jgi:hypothetical protein
MKKLTLLCFLLIFSCALRAQVPTNGLIYQYEFTNNFYDAGPTSNNASNNGAYFNEDRCNVDSHAISFNGNNAYIDLGKMDSLNQNLQNHTMSFWMLNGQHAGDVIWGTSNNSGAGLRYSIGYLGSGEFFVSLRDDNGKTFKFHKDISYLDTTKWHHVAIVMHNTATDSARLFIDSSEVSFVGSLSTSPAAFSSFDHNVSLGGFNDRGTIKYHAESLIDDFYIYSRSLTPSEVVDLYQANCPGNTVSTHNLSLVKTKVYPNPANNQIAIEIPSYSQLSKYTLKVYNALGSVVHSQDINAATTTISTYTVGSAGTYILEIYDSNSLNKSRKVLIIN